MDVEKFTVLSELRGRIGRALMAHLPIWLEISHFTDGVVGVPTDLVVSCLVKCCTSTERSVL